VEIWEVIAREEIRRTIGAYTQGGDRFRLEELAACFTEDGALEVDGREPVVGRAAIVAFLSGVPKEDSPGRRIYVRHHVSSIAMSDVTERGATANSYFAVMTPIGLDHWGRYRDRLVPVGDRWLFEHRYVKVEGHSAGSYFGA
jgi:hypothetical protein